MIKKDIEYYENELDKMQFGLLDSNNIYLKLQEEQLKLIIQNLKIQNKLNNKEIVSDNNDNDDFWIKQLQNQISNI